MPPKALSDGACGYSGGGFRLQLKGINKKIRPVRRIFFTGIIIS